MNLGIAFICDAANGMPLKTYIWIPLKTLECGNIFRNCAAEKRMLLEVFEHHRPLILINWE